MIQINPHEQRTEMTEHQQILRVCCYCNLRRRRKIWLSKGMGWIAKKALIQLQLHPLSTKGLSLLSHTFCYFIYFSVMAFVWFLCLAGKKDRWIDCKLIFIWNSTLTVSLHFVKCRQLLLDWCQPAIRVILFLSNWSLALRIINFNWGGGQFLSHLISFTVNMFSELFEIFR